MIGSYPSRTAGLIGDGVLVMEIDPEERLVWREPMGKLPFLLFEDPIMLLPNCCLLLLLLLPSRLLDRAAAPPPSCLGLDPCTPSPLDLGRPPSVGRERLPSPLGNTFIDTWRD